MVKITDTINEENIQIKQMENKAENSTIYTDPTTRQNKNMKIQLRLTPAIEQQLRQYAEVKGTTVTDAVETIVTQKFHNKKINRQYFNLQQPATLLVPKTVELLTHYDIEEINLLATITETSTDTYSISSFDKQADLFTKHPETFEVVTIQQGNNALDTYDYQEECYYNTYGLQQDQNKYLNHVGLIFLLLEGITEEGIPTNLRLPLFIHVYDTKIKEAKIISQAKAVALAKGSDNLELLDYLENIGDVVEFEGIDKLLTVNELLNSINYELQQEVNELKNSTAEAEANQQLQQRLTELQEENRELKDELNNIDDLIKERLADTFKYAMEKINLDDMEKQ